MKKGRTATGLMICLSLVMAICLSAGAEAPDSVRIEHFQEATDEELAAALAAVEGELRDRMTAHIALDQEEMTLVKNDLGTLTAEILDLDEGLTAGEFQWSSSDESVAIAGPKGTVRAVDAGKAVITCSAMLSNGFRIEAECPVEVTVPVERIGTDPWEINMVRGTQAEVEVTVEPANASNPAVIFASSDENVATVSGDGVITAGETGRCTVSVTAADGTGKKAEIRVYVRQEVESITVEAAENRVAAEYTLQLKAVTAPGNAHDRSVAWSSSDETVATVDAYGKVTGISAGKATITAKALDGGGAEGSFEVEVYQPMKTITVADNPVILAEYTWWRQTVTVLPGDTENKEILWSSDNEKVATVDENGTITGHKVGTCRVTGRAADGFGATVTVDVEVRTFHYVLRTADEIEVGFETENSDGTGMMGTLMMPSASTGGSTLTPSMPSGSGTLTPSASSGEGNTLTPSMPSGGNTLTPSASTGSDTLTPNMPSGGNTLMPSTSSGEGNTLTPSMPSGSGEGTLTPSMPSGNSGTLTPSMPSSNEDTLTPNLPANSGTLTPNMPSGGSESLTPNMPSGSGTLTPSIPSGEGNTLTPSMPSGNSGTLTPSMPSGSDSDTLTPSMPTNSGTITPNLPSGNSGTLTPNMPTSGGTLTPTMPTSSGTLTPTMPSNNGAMPSASTGSGTLMPSPGSMGGMTVKSTVEVDYGKGCVTSETPGKIKPVKPGADRVTVRYIRNKYVRTRIEYDIYVAQSAFEEPEEDDVSELINDYLKQSGR